MSITMSMCNFTIENLRNFTILIMKSFEMCFKLSKIFHTLAPRTFNIPERWYIIGKLEIYIAIYWNFLFSLEKKIQIVYESFATKSFTDYFVCLTNILLGLDKLGNLASVASLVLFTDGDKFTKGRRKKSVRFGWFVSLKEGGGGA